MRWRIRHFWVHIKLSSTRSGDDAGDIPAMQKTKTEGSHIRLTWSPQQVQDGYVQCSETLSNLKKAIKGWGNSSVNGCLFIM